MPKSPPRNALEMVEADHKLLRRLLNSPQPCFIGRIAGIELKVAHTILEHPHQLTSHALVELENNAGIHTTSRDSLREYAIRLMKSYEDCSAIGEWEREGKVFALTGTGQEWIAQRTPHIPKISALSLEPYYLPNELSWMPALKGKRVLILHPFVHTLQKQVEHLKEVYPAEWSWFNDCTFQFVRPPLTLAGNHESRDWKEHYEACLDVLRACEPFDVALVGAGGYGMLLSQFIYRELNASVLYIGGALQLFFGVIGKRWFTNRHVMSLMNDAWVRPVKEDHPAQYQQVERGCYW